MGIIFLIASILMMALATDKFPKIREMGLHLISSLDTFVSDIFGDKGQARFFLPVLASIFLFVFIGNLSGLIFDYINFGIPALHAYLRPINSDLNTTIVLALWVVVSAQIVAVIRKWFFHHMGHYLFNFSGEMFIEKAINVFVGWLHLIGELARVVSLSLRLFCNIFAWVILLAVMYYIGESIPHTYGIFGGVLSLPFWFFELLVALLQAFIFMTLSSIYWKEASVIEQGH